MADVSNIRTDWENVSQQDWLENNAKAQANIISGAEMNTIGQAIKSINSEISAIDVNIGYDDLPTGTTVMVIYPNTARPTSDPNVRVHWVGHPTAPANAITGDLWEPNLAV